MPTSSPKKANQGLINARLQRGWTQREVAEAVGTTLPNVSRWERGVTFPSPYFRRKLCEVFEASPRDLDLILAQRCSSQIGSEQTENDRVEAELSNPVAARQEQVHEFDNMDHSQETHDDRQKQEHSPISPGSFWIFERTFFFLIIMLLFTPPITKEIRRWLKETQGRVAATCLPHANSAEPS